MRTNILWLAATAALLWVASGTPEQPAAHRDEIQIAAAVFGATAVAVLGGSRVTLVWVGALGGAAAAMVMLAAVRTPGLFDRPESIAVLVMSAWWAFKAVRAMLVFREWGRVRRLAADRLGERRPGLQPPSADGR